MTWQGSGDQTFAISANYKGKDIATIQEIPASTIVVGCQNDGFCRATIPVTAGTIVNWSVQAISEIDGRTFYSYPFRGEQDYAIPKCSEPDAAPGAVIADATPAVIDMDNLKVTLYPNPVHAILNINLKGTASNVGKKTIIQIYDVNGRALMVKQAAFGGMQVNVSQLSNGTYFLHVLDSRGKVVHKGKFIKN